MGIFGGSSNDNNSSSTFEDESIYSPSGGMSNEENFGDNSFEKIPDFMSSITYDAGRLQPAALQGGLDFLQVEGSGGEGQGGMSGGSLAPSRGWSDDLCYGTGTTYLAGLTLGGAFGMAEGLKKSVGSPNMKVRLNTTLNSITRRGPGVGNSLGVIAMVYNGATAVIDSARGEHDVFNSIAGGAIAGAIFKSTAGPRVAAISAGVCAGVGGAWSLLVSTFGDN